MTDETYFDVLEDRVDDALELANRARSEGADPADEVEIPIARDIADRVENLVGIDGVADRIRAFEDEEESREDVALRLADAFADGDLGDGDDRAARVEGAVRTAVALLTEGVVAAPIEGIDRVTVDEDAGGHLTIAYAGPIRSAGGTAQALSVLIADYVRSEVGIEAYTATSEEVERYVEEIALYDSEVGLQYTPDDDEVRTVVEHCPIRLTGEPTSDREVSAYRDVAGIDTNRARGGMCLVVGEGITQKASKLKKYLDRLDLDGWGWVDDLGGGSTTSGGEESDELKPKWKYVEDLTAGRPILAHPSREGGFRLRYGRARNTGFAAVGLNPATMVIFDDFLAAGTQLKTERPGKAAGIAPVDAAEGPTVRLRSGEIRRIDDPEEARRVRNGVEEIVDAGEIVVNYGEFLENNHRLAPASYTVEWWRQELAEAGADVAELDEGVGLDEVSATQAFALAEKYEVPLHPRFTYLWHDVDREAYTGLAAAAERRDDEVLVDATDDGAVATLEALLVPHERDDGACVVTGDHAEVLGRCLDRDAEGGTALEAAADAAGVAIRERAPTRIGARMGRPEKSKAREMSPAVHCLFPIGEAGGSQRDIAEAVTSGTGDGRGVVDVMVARRRCPDCETETFRARCERCERSTALVHECRDCGIEAPADDDGATCPRCGRDVDPVEPRSVDVKTAHEEALDAVDERATYDILKCVKGLTSRSKTPEPLEKGVLRAKHEVSAFKDGTSRYDMTDLPLTAIRPDEIGVSVERLREMGYEEDVEGEPLRRPEQVTELKPQDLVLSRDAASHLLDVAGFVDDLLERYYGVEPCYGLDGTQDLVGELVMGLAPHTSAGVLGRIVGFTGASVGYAHPFFHAAKRRNCDGDEDCVVLLMDALLNFSRSYLPDQRGGHMDAPLVMTTRIDPEEIDDEAHNVDTVERYPLSFYEATRELAHPGDVDVAIADDDLGTADALDGFGHTLSTSDIAGGPENSAYKTLGTMRDKTERQLELGRITRGVDASDVAERVIESHFLPDLIGNLRAFSQQQVRCTSCNTKYRRPPLDRSCRECDGDLTLTVHEGSVTKYLDVSLEVGDEYGVQDYTKQRLRRLDRQITSLFEDDTARQSGIKEFM